MKKILLVLLIPALAFMTSCGGSDEDGFMSQMKKMKEVADNAKEMQEEMDANPEDQDVIFSNSLLERMDVKNTDQVISDEDWTRIKSTIGDFSAMDSAQIAELNHTTLNTFFIEHGYENTDIAVDDMERFGKLSEFMLNAGIHRLAIMQTQLIDGKEGADIEVGKFADMINEYGYSIDDLKLIEENAEIEAKAVALRYTIEIINNKEEIATALDSAEVMIETESE